MQSQFRRYTFEGPVSVTNSIDSKDFGSQVATWALLRRSATLKPLKLKSIGQAFCANKSGKPMQGNPTASSTESPNVPNLTNSHKQCTCRANTTNRFRHYRMCTENNAPAHTCTHTHTHTRTHTKRVQRKVKVIAARCGKHAASLQQLLA